MIAVGQGVCSDEDVRVGSNYLGRIGNRYYSVVVLPYDVGLNPTNAKRIPWREAWWDDIGGKSLRPFRDFDEVCPIY